MSCSGSILAYAAHPRLAGRLGEAFQRIGIPFRLEGALVTVNAPTPAERRRVVDVMTSSLSPVERKLIRVSRNRLSHIFGAPDLEIYSQIVDTEWFERALEEDQFTMYFQPIVDVRKGECFAYECLIRLEGDRIYNGGEIVNAALMRNGILEFDTYARAKAIRSASLQKPRDSKLFINFFPSAMYDPEPCLATTLAELEASGIPGADIVFEIIECDQLTNPEHTRRICSYLRARGFQFAIDDLGVGTNSLDMILALEPNYIKIDKSIVWDLHDFRKRETVEQAVRLAAELGAGLIAEGIESAQMAADVRAMGIYLMQGYCFGRPQPAMRDNESAAVVRDLLRLSEVIGEGVTSSSADEPDEVLVSSRRTRDIPS
ncbi:MAG: EAL domain-containing protein [Bryobacteraceae bacterium]|nr:EAL domain-containing protein [Bryobacteraceae bacterium]